MSIFRDQYGFRNWVVLVFWGSLILAAIIVGCKLDSDEQAEWAQHAATHHCRPAGVKQGQVTTSLTTNGRLAVGTTPDQTIYSCDNGEIEIR